MYGESPRQLASLTLSLSEGCDKLDDTIAVAHPSLIAVNAMNFSLSDSVAVLTRTPATLRALLAGLPTSWTDASESAGSWTPKQVVAHLILADQANWIPRVRVFLEDAGRALPAFDPAAGLQKLAGLDLTQLIAEFERGRSHCLSELVSLALIDSQLDRSAVHPQFGPVTLRQLLATWTVHDLSHIAQIARVMSSQYRDAVGPWSAYLRVLSI